MTALQQCMDFTLENVRKRNQLMDDAIRCVLNLGYELDELRLERHVPNPLLKIGELDRLLVCGEPCYEVAISALEYDGTICRITYTPRLIKWPEDRT